MCKSITIFAGLAFLIAASYDSVQADIIYVPTNHPTIQAAIDIANPGDAIHILSGVYDEALDFEGKSNLSIISVNSTPTLIRPSSTLAWDVGGYGSSRTAGVRIINCSEIDIENLHFDFDLIKGNDITGVLIWDSEIEVRDCRFENMSASDAAGQESEIMIYARAPSHVDQGLAASKFWDCEFIETGRVGILAHEFVYVGVSNGHFEKTIPDFGYAVQVGLDGTLGISYSTITGYSTPSTSDGSVSAGILIENGYTQSTTAWMRGVIIHDNVIENCGWGIRIRNDVGGSSADVELAVSMSDNIIRNNLEGGILITDEGAENVPLVSATLMRDSIADNGSTGIYVFCNGDGNLHIDLDAVSIIGHNKGLALFDTTTVGSSVFDLVLRDCVIAGNSEYGIENVGGSTVIDARYNYWGDASGPSGVGLGTGDAVSTEVLYDPWDIIPKPGCCGRFTGGVPGNTDCSENGVMNLADITRMIDRTYISKEPGCCEENFNVDNDASGKIGLADITKLIDVVYVSKVRPTPCL